MPIGAVGGAILGSAVIGAISSDSAADAQAEAAGSASAAQLQAQRESNALQKEMYDQNRADMQPWREAGMGALSQLSTGLRQGGDFNRNFTMADFQADPGYAFRQAEGQKAIDNSAAARGSSLSGATLKALSRYGQDYASNEYQNGYNRWNNDMSTRYNRLAGVAGTGQTATQQIGAYGQNTASNIAQGNMNTANQVASNIIGAGNARASGYVGMANALSGGANSYLTLSALGGGRSSILGGSGPTLNSLLD